MSFEFPGKTDRLGVPAEVAQSVEQWSEESQGPRFAKLLRISRLIPKLSDKTTWSKPPIVLKSAAGRPSVFRGLSDHGGCYTMCPGLGRRRGPDDCGHARRKGTPASENIA